MNDGGTAKRGFRDIKRDVFRRIRAREWGPGALLPGEVDLAAEYGCARATVNRAMRELAADGIIERRRKAGSRVRPSPARAATFEIPLVRAEIEARGAAYGYRLLASAVEPAPPPLQERLGLGPGARMRHVECLHLADGAPFQLEDRWIHLAAVPRAEGADFSLSGPNEWLVAEVPYTTAEVRLSAVAASPRAAGLLGAAVGAPLFAADRTTWLGEDPVTSVRLLFAPGHAMVALY